MGIRIQFADLCELLDELGFSPTMQPIHIVFEHPASDTLLVLRRYRADELVTPANLTAVRKLLDERGLLPADEFDSRLHKEPA